VIIGSGKEGLPIILGNMDNNTNGPAGAATNPAGGAPAPTPETAPPPAGTAPGMHAPPAAPPAAPGKGAAAEKKPANPAISKPAERTQAESESSSSLALDLSEIKAILSRMSEGLGLRKSTPPKAAGSDEQPKK